jgi:hypothetical protein
MNTMSGKITCLRKHLRYIVILVVGAVTVLLAAWLFHVIMPNDNQSSLRDMISGVNCSQPCWQTIIPGESNVTDVGSLIEASGIEPFVVHRLEGGILDYQWQHDSQQLMRDASERIRGVTVVFEEDGIVERVIVSVEVCVSRILAEYGIPNWVILDKPANSYQLLYERENLMFGLDGEYAVWIFRLAPQTSTLLASEVDSALIETDIDWGDIQHVFSGDCVDGFS